MSRHASVGRSLLLWFVALVLTAAAAIYQRVTGPTYPLRGSVTVGGTPVPYLLDRSHSTASDCLITVTVPNPSIAGVLEYRRYKSADPWRALPMMRSDGLLSGALPAQPAAGKLAYRLTLTGGADTVRFPDEPAVIRFKGDVPAAILVTHVALMFAGMLLSTRCGLEALRRTPRYGPLVSVTLGLLALGGLIAGPMVQHYAFGAYWTGWPAGGDLTDNKTAVIIAAWLLAALRLKRSPAPGRWVIAAAVATLAVYLIPHSLLGSELTPGS